MSLASRSIRRPVAVAMLFIAIIFLGLISFFRLPVDLLPDIAYPRLVVYTAYPGVAPAEVERLVTAEIERQVAAVPGVERIESVSREGISLVTLRFAWGTDMDFAALNVRERLDNGRDALPELASRPAVLRTDPASEPIMALSVAGDADLWELKELAETVIKRRLEQIDGVAQASVTGGLEREIHVDVDPRRLESFGITIQEIETALAAANVSAPGGRVLRGRYQYPLRTLGELQAVEQIGDVVVRREQQAGEDGGDAGAGAGAARLLRVRDVAAVDDGFRERESITRYNGKEAVGLLLFKEAGSNTVRVSEEVEAVLGQLREEFPALEIEVAMTQAGFISDAIANVIDSLVSGAVLAFLVLFLFLRDPRYPVVVALAIPISVVVTFVLLDVAGVTLNIMSLGGLALGVGMLVDNSIVVLENIFRLREQAGGKASAAATAAAGTEEVQNAIIGSTLSTIAVFGPIVYIEGVAGELFGALSLAVTFSLLASIVVALTLVPLLAARWGEGEARGQQGAAVRWLGAPFRGARRLLGRLFGRPLAAFDRAFARLAAWYPVLLARALGRRGRVIALTTAVLLGSLALGWTLDRAVLPQVDEGEFRVRLELPRGTPLERTTEATARLEAVFLADPDVAAVFTRVGRRLMLAGVEEEASGSNTAELDIRMARGGATAAAIERARPHLTGFPPGAVTIETGRATALGQLLGSAEADLAIRIRGEDIDAMLAYAQAVQARLARAPELINVRLGTELGQPEVRLDIDRERAASYGIQPQRIARTVEAYMQGVRATDFVDFDRKIPVIVRLPDSVRHSLGTLDLLRVDGVPLRQLISAREELGPAEIRRIDQARVVTVYADVAGRGLDEGIAAARAALADLEAPPGTRIEIGGENEEMRRGFRDLGFAFLLAILLVYMILAAEFESFVHPFTILLSVPLAVIGAAVALWLAGGGVNTMSLIGLVVLVGIVDNNAVVLVDFIRQQRERGMPLREAIIDAGRARLRPILMTTLTTMLGLVPLALGIGKGGELQAPLAIALIGGLAVATALTLVIVPVAYDMMEAGAMRVRRLFGLAASAPAATAAAGAGGQVAPPPAGAPALAGREPFAPEPPRDLAAEE
jgi:HAE1 family hydrophobic/amphiphilic exporter-1